MPKEPTTREELVTELRTYAELQAKMAEDKGNGSAQSVRRSARQDGRASGLRIAADMLEALPGESDARVEELARWIGAHEEHEETKTRKIPSVVRRIVSRNELLDAIAGTWGLDKAKLGEMVAAGREKP